MTTLSDFAITKRYQPKNAQAIQFYSDATPNGQKVAIMLEETGLAYDAHLVSIDNGDQFTPEFLAISPNNKIPAIIDPCSSGDQAIAIFESGAILIYLAEKSGQLMPADTHGRMQVLQWLMFQMGGLGPMFGQLGYFHKYDGSKIEDPRPRERYVKEGKRLLGVLEKQLEGREWITGDYSIADIAVGPWLRTIRDYYKAGDLLEMDRFTQVMAYLDRFLARPTVLRGLKQPPQD